MSKNCIEEDRGFEPLPSKRHPGVQALFHTTCEVPSLFFGHKKSPKISPRAFLDIVYEFTLTHNSVRP